jgi:hypothetical protein
MALYNAQFRIMCLAKKHKILARVSTQDFMKLTVPQAEELVHRAHEVRLEVLILYRQMNELFDELVKTKLSPNQVFPHITIKHVYREFTESRADKLFQLQTFCNMYLEQPSETTQEKIGDILWACTEDLTEHAYKWGSLRLDDFRQTTTLVADRLVPTAVKRKRAKSVDFCETVQVHTYKRDPLQIEGHDELSGSSSESSED